MALCARARQRLLLALALLSANQHGGSADAAQPPLAGVVRANGTSFTLDGERLLVAGTNQYYLAEAFAQGSSAGAALATGALDAAAALNLNVVRTWAFDDDPQHPQALQLAPGVYQEASLQGASPALASGARQLRERDRARPRCRRRRPRRPLGRGSAAAARAFPPKMCSRQFAVAGCSFSRQLPRAPPPPAPSQAWTACSSKLVGAESACSLRLRMVGATMARARTDGLICILDTARGVARLRAAACRT